MIKLQHRSAQGAQEAVTAPPAARPKTMPAIQARPENRQQPFNAQDGKSYRAAYRAAFDFHARHNPPTLEASYWDDTAADMLSISGENAGNHFLQELLAAAYTELQREYDRMKTARQ